MEILEIIQSAANNIGITRIALVGGAVRDGFLHQLGLQHLNEIRDLDLVVEGSASALAKEIQSLLCPKRISEFRIHSAYNTVEMKIDEFFIDLASARVESYPSPGENPNIKLTQIESDLARRDFTINAMAIELSNINLLDPFDGEGALSKSELDFLHPKSVADDPTRPIPAAKKAARLQFEPPPTRS